MHGMKLLKIYSVCPKRYSNNLGAWLMRLLTLNLLTTTIVAPPSNASKWQMGFNSAFKGLMHGVYIIMKPWMICL